VLGPTLVAETMALGVAFGAMVASAAALATTAVSAAVTSVEFIVLTASMVGAGLIEAFVAVREAARSRPPHPLRWRP
jgi:hypothetical protein